MAKLTQITLDELHEMNRRERAASEAWRAYLVPGTADVLRNKAGIEDRRELEEHERRMTTRRLADLPRTPHTPEGFKAIHRHLFQDVYEWAGKVRTVEMHRADARTDGRVERSAFIETPYIERGLDGAFRQVQSVLPKLEVQARMDPRLRDAETVGKLVAYHVADLNFVHAFRDGNGRAMRAQADNLAQMAGLRLNEAQLDREAWNRGSRESHADPRDTATLARAIGQALETREAALERERMAARGVRPPHVARHARDLPGARAERDYGLGD